MTRVRSFIRGSGFTLIEVLVAIALLSLMATATASWAVAQRRAGLIAEQRLVGLAAALTAARLIDADLALAVAAPNGQRLRLEEDGRLTFATLAQVPGTSPGVRSVTWRFRAGALERIEGEGTGSLRVVTHRLAKAVFERGPDGALTLVAESAEAGGQLWRLPLRQGMSR